MQNHQLRIQISAWSITISTVNERKQVISNIVSEILLEGKKLLFIIDELDRELPKYLTI
jgi:hypothetical protein